MQKYIKLGTNRVEFHRGHDTLCKIIILFFLHEFAEIVQKLQKLYPSTSKTCRKLTSSFYNLQKSSEIAEIVKKCFF